MRLHPRKRDLFAYVETLESTRTPGANGATRVDAGLARHLAQCKRCSAEAEAMRRSLEFVGAATLLEPTAGMTARILAAARAEQLVIKQRKAQRALLRNVLYASASAALLVCLGSWSFQLALAQKGAPLARTLEHSVARTFSIVEETSPEDIREAATQVQMFATALTNPPSHQPSALEWRHRRTALAIEDDLSAAMAALQRNPGCDRASRLIDANLRRQANTLKQLYVERTL